MKHATVVLRVIGAGHLHPGIADRFGSERVSYRKAGDRIRDEFPFSHEETWPGDVLIVNPSPPAKLGFREQLKSVMEFVGHHEVFLTDLSRSGAKLNIYCGLASDFLVTRVQQYLWHERLYRRRWRCGIQR